MNQQRGTWKRTAVLVAVLPMALTAVAYAASGESVCAEAQAWVESRRGELPASLQEITAFPRAYRRAIFSSLSPAQRSGLRQELLEAHSLHNPGWTPEQKETVRQARRLFRPEFFSHDPQSPAWNSAVVKPFEAFRSQALQVFTEREFYGFFLALGTASEADQSDGEAVAFPCNCNLALDNHCVSTNCTPKATGCGPTGGSRCNGHFAADPVPLPDDGIQGADLR